MKKKAITALLLAVMLTGTLAGCGSNSQEQKQEEKMYIYLKIKIMKEHMNIYQQLVQLLELVLLENMEQRV